MPPKPISHADPSSQGTESEPLSKPAAWNALASTEWVGLFLFVVGMAGILRKGLHRHYTLWGLPLDRIDLAILIMGACMMLLASPWAPWRKVRSGFWKWAAWLRFGLVGGALAFLVAWALN